jgi:hypothetical protein
LFHNHFNRIGPCTCQILSKDRSGRWHPVPGSGRNWKKLYRSSKREELSVHRPHQTEAARNRGENWSLPPGKCVSFGRIDGKNRRKPCKF